MVDSLAALQQSLTSNYLAMNQFSSLCEEASTSPCDSIFSNFNNYDLSSLYNYSSYNSYYGPTKKDLEYKESHSQADWVNYQAEQREILENNEIERTVAKNQKIASAKFRMEAPDKNIASELGDLNKYVTDDEQYKVTDAYKRLLFEIKEKYKAQGVIISDKDARSEIQTLYYQQHNKNLLDDVEENGSGYFAQGFKEGIGGGLGYLFTDNKNKTGKDNVNFITGQKRTAGDEAKIWTGRILSGVTTGAVAIAAIPLLALGAKVGGRAYINGVKALFGFVKK